MWEKIKNFFKWIADHTGISWVARKISSGQKWLFGGKANTTQQNTSQQGRPSGNEEHAQANGLSKTTTPKTLGDGPASDTPNQSTPPAAPGEPKEPVINTSETDAKELPENFPTPNPKNADSDVLKEASNENYLKVGGKGLLLVLTSEQFAKCKDYKDSQSTSSGGLLMYIKCGENEYRITGANNDNLLNTICIKSILKKSKDGKYVNGNIVLVEEEIKHVEKMLELNNDGVVKVDSISNRAFEAPTLEQPKPNSTSHNVTQQTVNNEGVATEELADTPDQPKSPAVPNEPRETLVNAHEEKGEPNNAASNEEVQPEVSNKEVAAEEHAPNLNENVDSRGGLGSEVSDNEGFEDDIEQPKSLEVQEDEVVNDMQNQGQSQNSNGMADPLAKPDQGSGDEPNQSSFDNESVKDDDKEADNPQPGASAEDNLGSSETSGRGDDTDKKSDEQLEVDGAKEKEPSTSFTEHSVQAASNDKTK